MLHSSCDLLRCRVRLWLARFLLPNQRYAVMDGIGSPDDDIDLCGFSVCAALDSKEAGTLLSVEAMLQRLVDENANNVSAW